MPERLRERATRDPFAITPDPNVYVPRAATEFARKELLRCACNPAKTAALIGPPGLGKTLLLHLLAKEAPEDLQTVYLPYAALPPEELCGWALGLLNLPTTGDPIGALRAHTRDLHERRSSLLLLIDDADSMPIATARWLGDLVGDAGHRVRLAIAASDNAAGNRVLAAIGSNGSAAPSDLCWHSEAPPFGGVGDFAGSSVGGAGVRRKGGARRGDRRAGCCGTDARRAARGAPRRGPARRAGRRRGARRAGGRVEPEGPPSRGSGRGFA
jgi:hypothetical protein